MSLLLGHRHATTTQVDKPGRGAPGKGPCARPPTEPTCPVRDSILTAARKSVRLSSLTSGPVRLESLTYV